MYFFVFTHNIGIGSDLIIRQGITSDRPDIERFFYFSEINQLTTKTYVVPLTMGFYVSLRGFFNYESRLALVYTTFSYMGMCSNIRVQPHIILYYIYLIIIRRLYSLNEAAMM